MPRAEWLNNSDGEEQAADVKHHEQDEMGKFFPASPAPPSFRTQRHVGLAITCPASSPGPFSPGQVLPAPEAPAATEPWVRAESLKVRQPTSPFQLCFLLAADFGQASYPPD